MTNNEFRSPCSIARTLEVVGDKWTLLIVRDLMWHDKNTFQALEESAENIPINILSDLLKRLERWGLLYREAYEKMKDVKHGLRQDLAESGEPSTQ